MRSLRIAALGTVLALLATLFSAGSATAASQGIGTSTVGTTIAQLDLGDLLSARILGDDSRSTIDKGVVSMPEAAMVLRPLSITSGVLPALNKEIAPIETRTQSGEKKTDYSTDLDSLLLPQVIDGTLTPATLSAIVDGAGARAGLVDTLTNLVVGGGLVTVDSIAADLGTNAAKETSTSNRGLDVGAISGLNLGALLSGLALPLDALAIPDIAGLTDELGLLGAGNPVASLLATPELSSIGAAVPTDAAGLNSIVTGIQAQIQGATDAGAALTAAGAACNGLALTALLPTLPATLPAQLTAAGIDPATACNVALASIPGLIAADNTDLGGLLSGLLSMLDGMELLNVSGVEAGLLSKATDDPATSVAKVTAAVGDLKVGNLATVPGLDAAATAGQVTGAVDAVTAQLDSVLGVLGLDGIVNLKLLDTTGTGVTKTPTGYVRSIANLTGVDLSIVPPADLDDLIAGLPVDADNLGIGDVLGEIPGLPSAVSAPALPGTLGMEQLNTLLAGAAPAGALTDGLRLRLASVGGVAEFLPATAAAPAPTGGTLPRTGGAGPMTGFAVAAIVMALLGLGVRRQVLAPVRVD